MEYAAVGCVWTTVPSQPRDHAPGLDPGQPHAYAGLQHQDRGLWARHAGLCHRGIFSTGIRIFFLIHQFGGVFPTPFRIFTPSHFFSPFICR